MADEPRRPQPNGEPPAKPEEGVPPKLKVDTSRLKSETSRIELSATRPPGAGAEGEARKQATMHIDLSQAPGVPTPPAKQTSRINLGDSTVTAPGAPGAPPRATTRIDLGGGAAAPAEPQAAQAKKMTARIDLAEAKPAAPGLAPEAPKRATARIELPGAGAPPPLPAEPPPRTVRIKPPAAPTVAVKRMPEMAPAGGGETHRKSETARIEMPSETIVEQPVTRRKTIRIKRPEAGVEAPGHVVTIARPEGAEAEAAAALAAATGEAEPGAAFSFMALVSTVIILVLVYVLAAQTVAPGLPFMGKI